MKGRTARQGEKGSWSMVLKKKHLNDTYGITDEEIGQVMAGGQSEESKKAMWSLINAKRMNLNMAQLEELIKFVAANEQTHSQAITFVSSLLNRDLDQVRKYLERRNKPQTAMQGKARILVLLDATGSMGNIINSAKDAVGEMFGRAGEIIDEHLGKNTDQFEMQFAVYRNYSSGPAKLLERGRKGAPTKTI